MEIPRIGHFKSIEEFSEHVKRLEIALPADDKILKSPESPLSDSLRIGDFVVGNRFAVHPMEGWDGEPDGNPGEKTLRRWARFGCSGAKLIWGGEAVAVVHEGRANPNQLLAAEHTKTGLAQLLEVLEAKHRKTYGTTDDLLVGLQLTHSGRFCRPNDKKRMEPQILFHHPILDGKFGIEAAHPVISDGEIREIIARFVVAAKMAQATGYRFVDVKHCHGYLGHEFLGAHTRPGPYGGPFENRTRFLTEIVEGIRSEAPGLEIGVRLSAFDFVSFRPDPDKSSARKLGPGIPDPFEPLLPYTYGFGVEAADPTRYDLEEPIRFLELLQALKIPFVNVSAGSPYYNPHIQRPAYYPPSDGYTPPEDPLVGVARQLEVVRRLKERIPDLVFVGTAYSYLQEFLPHVAQSVIRQGWVDSIGLGRMILSYPELPDDVLTRGSLQLRKICRTFSDCTTAPRNGLPSGCFPLDSEYKASSDGARLRAIKKAAMSS